MSGDPDTIREDNDAARLAAIRADVGFVGTDGETVLWQIARGDFEWLCARIAAVEAQRDELARAAADVLAYENTPSRASLSRLRDALAAAGDAE